MNPTEDAGIIVSNFTRHSLIKPKSPNIYTIRKELFKD